MTQDNYYKTHFNGDVDISSILDDGIIKKLHDFVEKNLSEVMHIDIATSTLYVNGDIDNSEDVVQKFIIKITPLLQLSEDVAIKAQGQDADDRWDILISNGGVYIREYEFTPTKLTKIY